MEVSHLLLLSILSAVMDKGLCLVCYCERSRLCVGDEDICEGANDVCFTNIYANGTYECACLEVGNDFFHIYNANNCLNKNYSVGFKGLLCCNDRDNCNKDLRPPPSSKESVTMETLAESGTDTTRDDNRLYQIYIGLTIAIPVLSLILITVIVTTTLIYFLLCGRKRRANVPASSNVLYSQDGFVAQHF